MSVLVICEYDEIVFVIVKFDRNQFKMQLSKKQITCFELFAPFLKSTLVFEHFKREDDPHSLYISQNTERK